MSNNNSIKIEEILERELIKTCFLPVVSVSGRSITGLEALSRGISPVDGACISPFKLFEMAGDAGIMIDIDRLCRKKALESFKSLGSKIDNCLLFLNIETSILDNEVVGSGYLNRQVAEAGLNPGNIVIEILESDTGDVESLERFINMYKHYGFIIALDDVGAGSSNLNRIAYTKPDLIKIDKYIVEDMEKTYHKQEIFKALVQLSRNIGALVVSEGVENENDALLSLEFGANMLQGFYFTKPVVADKLNLRSVEGEVERLASEFKKHKKRRIKSRRNRHERYENMISKIAKTLSSNETSNHEAIMLMLMEEHQEIECVYILDEQGIQSGATFLNNDRIKEQKRLLFSPAEDSSDHSLKDYYLFLNSNRERYVSSEYISMASGNLCITISCRFNDLKGYKYILCVDLVSGE